ncbi:MAG: polysaccharide deacetylase family protein [Akkermansia sp.]
MRNGVVGMWAFFVGICCMMSIGLGWSQSAPELPPLDPGVYIGAPSSKPAPSSVRNGNYAGASESGSKEEVIPLAEPIPEDGVPLAEPLPDRPRPVRKLPVVRTPTINGASTAIVPVLPPQSSAPVEQSRTQVSILGYHDFSETKPVTDMRIRTSVFRQQMKALKDCGMPVISMQDFLEWKNGARQLPANCVMITIDDGWKSVYTDAFPILKEFGFPFTVFPYTHFLTGQGASMSIAQVKELARHGAYIGSHSSRHLYPSVWKKEHRKGPEAYQAMMDAEIRDSRVWLQNNFSLPIECYCYPGGYNTPEMIEKIPEYGYLLAVTVIGKKALYTTENMLIPRYMVYGRSPKTFLHAVSFLPIDALTTTEKKRRTTQGATQSVDQDIPALPPPAQTVFPLANSIVARSTPTISIALGQEEGIDASKVEMRVSGFGRVPAQFEPKNKVLSWTPNRELLTSPVTVQVRWKSGSSPVFDQCASWQFVVREAKEGVIPSGVVK